MPKKLLGNCRSHSDFPNWGPVRVPEDMKAPNSYTHEITHAKTLSSTYGHSFTPHADATVRPFSRIESKNPVSFCVEDPV